VEGGTRNNNPETTPTEMVCQRVNRIKLAQGKFQKRAVVNMISNELPVSIKLRNFSTS
jgi:ABC-type microcin C transport system permease subunit YejB